jgi:TfoX/Sxy family transcriptional regulator of competence genes
MPWKKANKDLIDILEKMMLNYRCDRRMMFGAPTFFVNGNMFTGVHEDSIILRLSETDLKEMFAQFKEVKPFTPMGGHAMKEYAAVPESLASNPDAFKYWLDKSYNYASSLPQKAAKRTSGKR